MRIRARIFHFGYLMLLDQMDQPDARFGTRAARLLAAARTAGLKTSVDAASVESRRFSKVVSAALKHADYCILNELEAGKITGLNPRRTGGRLDPVALRRSGGRAAETRGAGNSWSFIAPKAPWPGCETTVSSGNPR